MIDKLKYSDFTHFISHWSLKLLIVILLIENIGVIGRLVTRRDNNNNHKNNGFLPKIITLHTFKDWSSKLDSSNESTPHSTVLIFEESKDVKTTDYDNKQIPMYNIYKKIKENVKNQPLITKSNSENTTLNAPNIAAEVLSKMVHISPLLVSASNHNPVHHLDNNLSYTHKSNSDINKVLLTLPILESDNEIDIQTNDDISKHNLIPITTSSPIVTTTNDINVNLIETNTVTQMPDTQQYDEEEHHNRDNIHEEDQQTPQEDSDDSDDEEDEENESFRYPIRVSFQDSDDDPSPGRESSPPFVIPDINLNPESLKQKGCRTIVKEVQAIPVENKGKDEKPTFDSKYGLNRYKRNTDPNSRKFMSIIMTKECHFPDDGTGNEEVPQALPTTIMSDSNIEKTFQTPSPEFFDEYFDEDFDFKPQYPKSKEIDRFEAKSTKTRKSYASNPLFRRDNDEYIPPKHMDFDDSEFYDFNEPIEDEADQRRPPKQPKLQTTNSPLKTHNKNKKSMSYSTPDEYDFDNEGFGPTPKPRNRKKIHKIRLRNKNNSNSKKPPVYNNERNKQNNKSGDKKKPKKVNKSFAFFRKAEPKDKDPNENDYSVSYGRGNFQSFSDSYDSDKDGPRKKRPNFDDEDDDMF